MKSLITTAILSAALAAVGCAEDASVRNDSDRYYSPVPPPAFPAAAQGGTNGQDLTLRAEPASAQIGPSDESQQPTLNPNMPSGNTIQPGGTTQGVPGTTARNPGTVPPTVPSGGNTTGAAGR